MELFRRKQKLVFWIVTIIIVPSFVLVWGYSGRGSAESGGDPELARVNGVSLSLSEFQRFRQRLTAAIGEIPYQVSGAPENEVIPGLWSYLWSWYIISEAEKAEVGAADNLVGTYLRNTHSTVAARYRQDPSSLEAAVEAACLRNQVTRAEFMRGVKEWLTLVNYVELDSGIITGDLGSAYLLYALDRAEFDLKRLRVVPDDATREAAKQLVMAKPESELQTEVRARIEASASDPRYRQEAKWRLAYVLLPMMETVQYTPDATEIEARYNTDRDTIYSGKSLEEVRDAVAASLVQQERERLTLRNLTVDVDVELRQYGNEPMEKLPFLTKLLEYNAKAGDTGPEPLTSREIAEKSPLAPVPVLTGLLDMLDRLDPEFRDREIADWKAGFMFTQSPLRTEAGFIRLKLLDYQPSEPKPVDTPDGTIDPSLYEAGLTDLVAEQVDVLLRERVERIQQELAELLEARRSDQEFTGEVASLFDALPVESLNYRDITGSNEDYQNARLGVYEFRGPLEIPAANGGGWELVVLTERRLPNPTVFQAEAISLRNDYLNRIRVAGMGRVGYSFSGQSLVQMLQPSEEMYESFWNRIANQDIVLNREFIVPGGES
ncbi:MAG: SurA N-terminal domain-containing protein [Planctomycetota bacterium]|jgi:hypothetical protein|nr:SurA N-terminal domain-containing protein [Planctomycetota bacterium]